jgi:hypothetical protein
MFTFNGVLHIVRGTVLSSADSTGTETALVGLGSAGGAVEMEQNLTQLVINDGSLLYVWNGVSLTTISSFANAPTLAFIDQRIVFPLRASQGFQWTALGDATAIDPLDFASAEGSPDTLVAVLANLRELLLLGTSTGEVWHSVGGTTVFERSPSEYLQVGCAAARSAVVVGDTPIWLGQNLNGQAQVMGGRGTRLSTRAIEERFEGIPLAESRAYTFSDGPFLFYCLNVPNVDTTLVYDLTFRQWHERAELIDGNYAQWRPECHAFAYGQHWFGGEDGVLYKMDPTVHTFAGDPICRERVAPAMSHPDLKRLRFPRVEVLAESATNGQVMLRYSDDNGYNFSSWHYGSAGATGNYKAREQWYRLGSARDRVFAIRMTDDAPWNPIMADVEVK